MEKTIIQKAFKPVKKCLPRWIWEPIRRVLTAFITPLMFSIRSGHFYSSFKGAAVSRKGEVLPWYTYPAVDFLKYRCYEGKHILEFGGGQSTLWWAERAENVVTFEGDKDWCETIRGKMPPNVDLHLVSMESPEECIKDINRILGSNSYPAFDVIIIDGLCRREIIDVVIPILSDDGMIICDNAEGHGIFEGFENTELNRIDFFGYCPGVLLPHCTSMMFKGPSFLFSPKYPIPLIARD